MEDPENLKKLDTSIDLGEDLLEEISETKSIDDDLQKAEILMSEKLFDDAKKIYRKVLRIDGSNPTAKRFLEEIQKQEIQDLLSAEASRNRFIGKTKEKAEDPSSVLDQLEKDLRLGVDKNELKLIPDLFPNEHAFQKYSERVMTIAAALTPKQRLDLGIAFLEMGVYELAQNLFEQAGRYDEVRISATYLLGLALIYGRKPIEATIRLAPLVRDLAIAKSIDAIDFLYLMGLAFEKLKDLNKAREFFKRVYQINPRYRDVTDKVR